MIFAPPNPAPFEQHKEELREIKQSLSNIENNMPRKSKTQMEIDELNDTVLEQSRTIQELQRAVNNLTSLSENLLKYIEDIDEIKRAGGLERKIDFDIRMDGDAIVRVKHEIITIPQVKLARIMRY